MSALYINDMATLDSLFTEKQAAPVTGAVPLRDTLMHIAGKRDKPGVREEDLIDLNDYSKRRQEVFDKTLKAVEQAFPVSNDKYTLRATNIKYADAKEYSKAEYKKAVLEGRSLGRKIVGNYELVDNLTNQVVMKTGRKTLMNVPYMTEFGTFVRNGNDIAINNQMRLRSGIYTRFTADGYPEAQFNVKPGTGLSFRAWMDPATSVFYMTTGGRKVPLYPIMNKMGIPDNQIEATWGKEVFAANKTQEKSSHAQRWINEMQERFDAKIKPEEVVDELQDEPVDFGKKDMSEIEEVETE